MKNRLTVFISFVVFLAVVWPAGLAATQSAAGEDTSIFLPLVKRTSKYPLTFNYASYGEPQTLDTAYDYETGGGRVIFNLYDTLIFYNREDPNTYIPQLATEVPSQANGGISDGGLTYTFHIRSGVKFHDGSALTVEDVAYSFQQGILQGGSQSPQWLLTEPLLGFGTYDIAELVDPNLVDDPEGLQVADPAKLLAACQAVTNAIVPNTGAGTVTFHLAQPFAPFLTILPQPWGSIRSKAWVMANGGWDGNCSAWQNYYGKTFAELNATALGSSAMGSGPYKLDHWTPGVEIVLKANNDYWRTTPAWTGGPHGAPALKTINLKYVESASERLAMYQTGDADGMDTNGIDPTNLEALVGIECDETGNCSPSATPTQPLRRTTGYLSFSRTDMFPVWQINSTSPLIGSGVLDGNGIPVDFFSDEHVRKAFYYCFNYQTYLDTAFSGAGTRSINVMLPGMTGYENAGAHYTYDKAKCEAEFKASTLTSPGGASLWDTGFYFKIAYNEGQISRQTMAEIFQDELASLNSKFRVEPASYSWTDYLSLQGNGKVPILLLGWSEDYHDTHNWVVPYTIGTYGQRQQLPQALKDDFEEIINRGVSETDPALRANIYHEFNALYYGEAVAAPLFIPYGRNYQHRNVVGWYPNPIYFGYYFYVLSKN